MKTRGHDKQSPSSNNNSVFSNATRDNGTQQCHAGRHL